MTTSMDVVSPWSMEAPIFSYVLLVSISKTQSNIEIVAEISIHCTFRTERAPVYILFSNRVYKSTCTKMYKQLWTYIIVYYVCMKQRTGLLFTFLVARYKGWPPVQKIFPPLLVPPLVPPSWLISSFQIPILRPRRWGFPTLAAIVAMDGAIGSCL